MPVTFTTKLNTSATVGVPEIAPVEGVERQAWWERTGIDGPGSRPASATGGEGLRVGNRFRTVWQRDVVIAIPLSMISVKGLVAVCPSVSLTSTVKLYVPVDDPGSALQFAAR